MDDPILILLSHRAMVFDALVQMQPDGIQQLLGELAQPQSDDQILWALQQMLVEVVYLMLDVSLLLSVALAQLADSALISPSNRITVSDVLVQTQLVGTQQRLVSWTQILNVMTLSVSRVQLDDSTLILPSHRVMVFDALAQMQPDGIQQPLVSQVQLGDSTLILPSHQVTESDELVQPQSDDQAP